MLEVLSKECPHSSIPDPKMDLFCKQLAENNKSSPSVCGCKVGYGSKPPSCNSSLLSHRIWLLYIKTQIVRCCQSLQKFFLHHRPSSSWSDASGKPTAPHKNILAKRVIYHAQNSACVTQNAGTMKTVTL